MKRTAFVVAMLLAVAATFLYLLGADAVMLFAAALFLLSVVLWVFRSRLKTDAKSIFALLAVVLISVSFAVRSVGLSRTFETLNGKDAKAECVVKEEPVSLGDRSRLTVEVLKTDSGLKAAEGVKCLLYVRNSESAAQFAVGDVVSADVTFEKIEDGFVKNYYYRGVYFTSFCRSVEVVGHKSTVYEYFVSARQYIRRAISSHLGGDSSALLKGLMLGDKTEFSDELYYNFKACGLSHIVAISGLHINIISLALYSVLSKIVGRRKASALMFLPLVFVIAVTGFTPSAIRAGIMFGLFLLGKVLLKNPDSLNSLGVAVSAMLIFNPYYISSISFQLSVAATAGIILCGPFADKVAKRVTKRVNRRIIKKAISTAVKVAVLSVAANLFTMPFTALYFGFVSVVSPVVSVFVTAAATYLLILGSLAVALSLIPFVGYYPASGLFILCDVLTKYMSVVAKFFAAVPFSYVPIDYKTVYISLAAVLCLAAVWILLNKVGGKRCLALMSAGLLILGLVSNSLSNINSVRLTVVEAHITGVVLVKNGKCAVIGLCVENRQAVLNTLKLNSVTEVETVVSFDGNEGSAQEMLAGYRVNRVLSTVGLTKGYQTDVLNNVTLSANDKGFDIKCFDKNIRFVTAETISEALKADCDLCLVKFPSGNIRAVKNGRVLDGAEDGLSFKIREGKDVVYCG